MEPWSICATTVPASRGGLELPLEFIVPPCVLEFIPSSSQHVDLSIRLFLFDLSISPYWSFIIGVDIILSVYTHDSHCAVGQVASFFHSDASDFKKSTKCSVLILDSPPVLFCLIPFYIVFWDNMMGVMVHIYWYLVYFVVRDHPGEIIFHLSKAYANKYPYVWQTAQWWGERTRRT